MTTNDRTTGVAKSGHGGFPGSCPENDPQVSRRGKSAAITGGRFCDDALQLLGTIVDGDSDRVQRLHQPLNVIFRAKGPTGKRPQLLRHGHAVDESRVVNRDGEPSPRPRPR